MQNVILVRYGEIHLKGHNRGFFEEALLHNIKNALSDTNIKVSKIAGRYLVRGYEIDNEIDVITAIQTVFGITSISPAVEVDTSVQNITDYCAQLDIECRFKVDTTRADKKFPIKSLDFSSDIGGVILDHNKDAIVDLHTPDTIIKIDIRENGKTYIVSKVFAGLGGMPVSTSGRGLLMLSGGIDSPVAGFLMAKRGLSVNAIYFHSFPYTSEMAKQKVVSLSKVIKKYCGNMNLYVVPFTKIQEEINALCNPKFLITVMRRFMFRIAEQIAIKNNFSCLITGENLAQVASQTVQGITCSNDVMEQIPIFRPLISFDKVEIMDIARKIGTFDISNLPYEDCCTVFVPKNPAIKPSVADAQKQEERIINSQELIEFAINNTEIINI